MYGGAGGGGKTDALLMSHLRFAEIPGYSGLILMRTYADLAKPKAAMDRAHEWLDGTEARWNDQQKFWTFPSGAKLSFGYLASSDDHNNYRTAEYQQIGVDEITRFPEQDYRFMFSRLRRLAGVEIPIMLRSATNPPQPGEPGARWIKQRFIPEGFTPAWAESPQVYYKTATDAKGREVQVAFVPARLEDNPHIDQPEYDEALSMLDSVMYEQIRHGDWDIQQQGNIFPMWEDGEDGRHVITWQQFSEVFKVHHIPTHWLGAHGHDPGFLPDPRAAVWNFTAAENGPLSGDIFCMRELYATEMTVDDFAERVKELERPLNEAARISLRMIGHEESSEKATLEQKHKLFYIKAKPDATGGIAQMRHYLRITDEDKPHPFKPWLNGRPHFYVVVADREELINPQSEKGMVNFRAEISAYRYIDAQPTQLRGMPRVVVPYNFFNHCMDAQRNLAVKWFAMPLALSAKERIERALPTSLHMPEIERGIADGSRNRQGAWMARVAEIARIEKELEGETQHPLADVW